MISRMQVKPGIRSPKTAWESRPSFVNLLLVVFLLAGVTTFLQYWWSYDGDQAQRALAKAEATIEALSVPTDTPAPSGVFSVAPTVAATNTPTAELVFRDREIEVTRIVEVTREVTRYIEAPYEVTRIVEVTPVQPVVLPTATPAPLAPGTVEVCASVEGATALYIGGQGVVSGGCQVFSFGIGQTAIQVHVNK